MPFTSGPVLRYVGMGRYETIGPTVYLGSEDVITIPGGFGTDLATVPRIFWALIPPSGAYERAAVLHDAGCVELAAGTSALSSRDVDGLFRRVMRESGVGVVTRWVMWVGVRWGALVNPVRRAGWWRDAPLVLLLTAVCLALVLAVTWGVHQGVDRLLNLL